MEPKTFYCQIINFKSINRALDNKVCYYHGNVERISSITASQVLRVAGICDILATFPGCYPTHYQGCY